MGYAMRHPKSEKGGRGKKLAVSGEFSGVPHQRVSEARAVVTWEGPGEPIVLTVYGPDGEVALPLLPKRALTLAQELLTHAVQAIKADSWDDMYGQGAPARGPDLGKAVP